MESAHTASWKKVLLLSGLVLLVGAALILLIFSTEPEAVREGAQKQTAMLVEVTQAQHGSFHPSIQVTGTVEAAQDIVLSPRVSGRVISLAPEFVPGGFVEKGQKLLSVDPSDYRNAVQQRRGDLSEAMALLHLERGRQSVAREEYEQLFSGPMSDEEKALVLRKPQLAAAKMRVDAAKAAVHQAQLDVGRTTIEAPFAAQVLTRNTNVGSQVAPGDPLARLVGVETYWVVATVPVSKRAWLSFAEGAGQGKDSQVTIRNRGSWPQKAYRIGRLDRLVGALDEQTRMAKVIVSVDDPLLRDADSVAHGPPLMVGEFVEVHIRGKQVSNVVRLERDHVRKNGSVWVMQHGKLDIRQVDIVMSDERYAYVSQGLKPGERIVTTDLATVTQGAKLRVDGSGSRR